METEISTFADLLEFLAKIPLLNSGGCAISALTMYRWLSKRGEDAKIAYFYDSVDSYSKYQNDRLKRGVKSADPNGCAHAMIKYKGKYYDSNGVKYDKRKHHFLSEHIVLLTINHASNWSPLFCRRFISVIEKHSGVDLSDVTVW